MANVNRAAHRAVAELKGLAPHEFFGTVYGSTLTHCCVCRRPLTDALSVQKAIGPICSRKFYSDEPRISDETLAVCVGMVAMLDARHSENPGAIDAEVIDYILANKTSSRAFANILLAWASYHAQKGGRLKVTAITPVLRVLGYPSLADKLEMDRTPHRIMSGVDTFGLIVPARDMWSFTRKCGWIAVPFEKSHSGHNGKLTFKATDRGIVWLLLKSAFHGKPLSIEGKGIVEIPTLSDKDKETLNARDVRNQVKATPVAPVVSTSANGFTCRLEEDPKKRITRVFSTPPWECDEAREFVDALRKIKGRKWHPMDKCWSVPTSKRAVVAEAAKAHFGLTII